MVKAHNDEYAKLRQDAAVRAVGEARTVDPVAEGSDEFDTFGETDRASGGCLPDDPVDPATMLDRSASMGATL